MICPHCGHILAQQAKFQTFETKVATWLEAEVCPQMHEAIDIWHPRLFPSLTFQVKYASIYKYRRAKTGAISSSWTFHQSKFNQFYPHYFVLFGITEEGNEHCFLLPRDDFILHSSDTKQGGRIMQANPHREVKRGAHHNYEGYRNKPVIWNFEIPNPETELVQKLIQHESGLSRNSATLPPIVTADQSAFRVATENTKLTCPNCGIDAGEQLFFQKFEQNVASWLTGEVCPPYTQGYDVHLCSKFRHLTFQVKFSNICEMEFNPKIRNMKKKWQFYQSQLDPDHPDYFVLFGIDETQCEHCFLLSRADFISHSAKAGKSGRQLMSSSNRSVIRGGRGKYLYEPFIWKYLVKDPELNLEKKILECEGNKQLKLY